MTGPVDDRLLNAVRGAYASITGNAALMTLAYDTVLDWNGVPSRCAVKDLNRDANGIRLASALASTVEGLDATAARLVYVRPGDPEPREGHTAPFQGGTLTLIRWQMTDELTGDAALLCRWSP